MRTTLHRGLLAVVTALAVLAASATPARASSSWIDGHMVAGSETIWNPWYEDECSIGGLPELTMSFSGNAGGGTWTASGSFTVRFRLSPPNDAQLWQADLNILAASGTYASPGPSGYTHSLTSSGPNHITFEANLYRVSPPECETWDLACTVRFRSSLDSGSAINSWSLPSPTFTDYAIWLLDWIPATAITAWTPCPATISSQLVGEFVQGQIYFYNF